MERYLHTIYCDDIRLEAGNKQSLMGIYTGDLYVAECPAVLPKLCIVVNIVTSIEKPFKKLIIRVTKDDDLLVEAPMTEEQIAQPQMVSIENGDKDDRLIIIGGSFVLSPFSIDKDCVLRVRAETENGELKGAGLRVKIVLPQQAV